MMRWSPYVALVALLGLGACWPIVAPQLPGAQVLLAPTEDHLYSAIVALATVGLRAAWILLVPGMTGALLVYGALRPDLTRPVQADSRPGWPLGSRGPSSSGSDRPPS